MRNKISSLPLLHRTVGDTKPHRELLLREGPACVADFQSQRAFPLDGHVMLRVLLRGIGQRKFRHPKASKSSTSVPPLRRACPLETERRHMIIVGTGRFQKIALELDEAQRILEALSFAW